VNVTSESDDLDLPKHTTSDICQVLGLHRATVARACRDYPGLSVRWRFQHRFTPRTVERLLKGLSFEEAARLNLAERERLSA
jgi:AraC-like DNA-binding protein